MSLRFYVKSAPLATLEKCSGQTTIVYNAFLSHFVKGFNAQEIDNLLNRLLGEVSTGCNGGVDLEFTEIDIQENKVTITVVVRLTV